MCLFPSDLLQSCKVDLPYQTVLSSSQVIWSLTSQWPFLIILCFSSFLITGSTPCLWAQERMTVISRFYMTVIFLCCKLQQGDQSNGVVTEPQCWREAFQHTGTLTCSKVTTKLQWFAQWEGSLPYLSLNFWEQKNNQNPEECTSS